MTTTLVASGSLAVALPGAATLQASFALNIERELAAAATLLIELQADLPDLKLSLDAALSIVADLSLNIADPTAALVASLAFAADAQLAFAANLATPAFAAALSAGLAAQLTVAADLTAKVSLKVDAIAEVTARIEALKIAASLAASFGTDLLTGEIRVFLYEGPLADLGLPGGSDSMPGSTIVRGAMVVTNSSVSFEAMKKVFSLEVAL